jgi:glycosyltransferase involved in cell wall biosynthesis
VTIQRGTGIKRTILKFLWFLLPLPRANALTAISESTRRELCALTGISEQAISVIPAWHAPEFTFSAKPFPSQGIRVLHVGTRSNKNLARVAQALESLPIVLVIVGPLNDDLLELLKHLNIRYENHINVPQRKIVELYREADIVSFPSLYEGFGLPIIEGQAIGRPVLTSNLPPMNDVCGVGGAVLVDPLSIGSIRTGFLKIISDAELRKSMVNAGLQNSARYSRQNIAHEYGLLYKRLLLEDAKSSLAQRSPTRP